MQIVARLTRFRFRERTDERDFIAFSETTPRNPAGAPEAGSFGQVGESDELIPLGSRGGSTDRQVLVWTKNERKVRALTFHQGGGRTMSAALTRFEEDARIVYLGRRPNGIHRLLEWTPNHQTHKFWSLELDADPKVAPKVSDPKASQFGVLHADQRLLRIGGNRILLWTPGGTAAGAFRILELDVSSDLCFLDSQTPIFDGEWPTLQTPRKLLSFGDAKLLDWHPDTNEVRIWLLDWERAKDPIRHPALWHGTWDWLSRGQQIVALDGGRLLVWRPASGAFELRSVVIQGGVSYDEEHQAYVVGRNGGRQVVFVRPDLPEDETVSTALHEIGHALGLGHEHQRSDSDSVIDIDFDQVQPGFQNMFSAGSDETQFHVVPYDFGSRMHYGPTAFSVGDLPTIVVRDTRFAAVPGLASLLSEGDVATLNWLAQAPCPQGPVTGSYRASPLHRITDDVIVAALARAGQTRALKLRGRHLLVWRYHNAQVYELNEQGLPAAKGLWKPEIPVDFDFYQQVVNLPNQCLLDYSSGTHELRVRKYQLDPQQDFLVSTLTQTTWHENSEHRRLLGLRDNLVFDWQASTGAYVVWEYDSAKSPLPLRKVLEGDWASRGFDFEHVLHCVDGLHLVDFLTQSGYFRLYRLRDPLPHPGPVPAGADPLLDGLPLSEGFLDGMTSVHTTGSVHQLAWSGQGQLLAWDQRDGRASSWRFRVPEPHGR